MAKLAQGTKCQVCEGTTFPDFQLDRNRPRVNGRVTLGEMPPPLAPGRPLADRASHAHAKEMFWGHCSARRLSDLKQKWRQHSSCYRSASVRVVMVAAHKSRYLPSEGVGGTTKKTNRHRPQREAHSRRPDTWGSEWSWPTGSAP